MILCLTKSQNLLLTNFNDFYENEFLLNLHFSLDIFTI